MKIESMQGAVVGAPEMVTNTEKGWLDKLRGPARSLTLLFVASTAAACASNRQVEFTPPESDTPERAAEQQLMSQNLGGELSEAEQALVEAYHKAKKAKDAERPAQQENMAKNFGE